MCMAEMEKVFKNLDTDGDSVVTFKEFVGIVTEIAMKSPSLDISKLSEDFGKLKFVSKIVMIQR